MGGKRLGDIERRDDYYALGRVLREQGILTRDPSRYQMAALAGLMARERREENERLSATSRATDERMEWLVNQIHQVVDTRGYIRWRKRQQAQKGENLGADAVRWYGDGEEDDLLGDVEEHFDFGAMLANQEQYMEAPD